MPDISEERPTNEKIESPQSPPAGSDFRPLYIRRLHSDGESETNAGKREIPIISDS